MDELISKQSVLDALRTCYDTETITMDNGDEYINYGDAVGEIEQLPSAQPKRGKWQYNGKHGTFKIYTCDQCGWNYEAEHNYCPHCGCWMDGGE